MAWTGLTVAGESSRPQSRSDSPGCESRCAGGPVYKQLLPSWESKGGGTLYLRRDPEGCCRHHAEVGWSDLVDSRTMP